MPALEPHEELKLAWELELMSVTIDKTRFDIEKIQQDTAETRLRIDKALADLKLDQDRFQLDQRRFWLQVGGIVVTALGVIVAAFAAGATWWNYLHVAH
jgi:hypothetical protein